MTVRVTERDDSHKSHEAVAAGTRLWNVYQQDLLVGIFHEESQADAYRQELEAQEQQHHA